MKVNTQWSGATKIKYRYLTPSKGSSRNHKRGTLATLEQSGKIWFGAAKCNIWEDQFLEERGRLIALERLVDHMAEINNRKGPSGCVTKENIVQLLQAFQKYVNGSPINVFDSL